MRRARSAGFFPALLAAALAACAHPPIFVMKNKSMRRTFYRVNTQDFAESPDFSFQIDKDWSGPESNKLGTVRYSYKGRAFFEIVYVKAGSPLWMEPVKYYQQMRERGSVEDRHILEDVQAGDRPGRRAVYTTYKYDPAYRVGEKSEATLTEEWMVPDPEGYHVLRYYAGRDDFPKHRKALSDVLSSIVLAKREGEVKEDVFAGTQRKRTVGDQMRINAMERDEADRKNRKRYQAGVRVGPARPVNFFSSKQFPRLLRPGYGLEAQFMYFPSPRLGVGAELARVIFPARAEILASSPELKTSADAQAASLSLSGRYRLADPAGGGWVPFASAALGVYTLTYNTSLTLAGTSLAAEKSDSMNLGFSGGAGLERRVHARVSVSAEARYRTFLLSRSKFNGGLLEAVSLFLGAYYLF